MNEYTVIYDWTSHSFSEQIGSVLPLIFSFIVAISLIYFFKKQDGYKNQKEIRVSFLVVIIVSNLYWSLTLIETTFSHYQIYKKISKCVQENSCNVIEGKVKKNKKKVGDHWVLQVDSEIFNVDYYLNLFTLRRDIEKVSEGELVKVTYIPGDNKKIIKLEKMIHDNL